MKEIELTGLRKVREAGNMVSTLVPQKEFDEVKNVLAYGVLRRWPEATKAKFRLKGVRICDLYNSYPHAFFDDDQSGVVNKMNNLEDHKKARIDSMETYAGYDTYEGTLNGKKYHIYIASDEIKKMAIETKKFDNICVDGDFIKQKIERLRERYDWIKSKRIANGETDNPTFSEYRKGCGL